MLCECGQICTRWTCRSVETRVKEHQRHISVKHPDKSAVVERRKPGSPTKISGTPALSQSILDQVPTNGQESYWDWFSLHEMCIWQFSDPVVEISHSLLEETLEAPALEAVLVSAWLIGQHTPYFHNTNSAPAIFSFHTSLFPFASNSMYLFHIPFKISGFIYLSFSLFSVSTVRPLSARIMVFYSLPSMSGLNPYSTGTSLISYMPFYRTFLFSPSYISHSLSLYIFHFLCFLWFPILVALSCLACHVFIHISPAIH